MADGSQGTDGPAAVTGIQRVVSGWAIPVDLEEEGWVQQHLRIIGHGSPHLSSEHLRVRGQKISSSRSARSI